MLLGEGRVGKTSLCLRYVENVFSDKQKSTITATYLDKYLNISKRTVKLMIWDTAVRLFVRAHVRAARCEVRLPPTDATLTRAQGQERFHALGPIYYREANGAVLVYDITDRGSFTKVRNWVKELRKIVGKDIVLCIVGNKIDMEKKRQVDKEEALKYAAQVGAVHCLASAKTGKGVEAAFLELTKGLLKKTMALGGGGRGGKNRRPGVAIQASDPEQQKPPGCC